MNRTTFVILYTCLLSPMINYTMLTSLVPELVMIKEVASLEYDDIPQLALVNTAWCTAVERTVPYRINFITQDTQKHITGSSYLQNFDKDDATWNKRGTACCFVDLARCLQIAHKSHVAIFRIQLTKYSALNLTISRIYLDSNPMQCEDIISGWPRTYTLRSSLHTKTLTCFEPFFNYNGEACVHTLKTTHAKQPLIEFKTTHAKQPLIEYGLTSKGVSKKRDVL